MTREAFRQRIEEKILVCDAPLGRLLAAGKKAQEGADLPELRALRDYDQVRGLHLESIEAGADIILTNTFAANRPTLEPLGLTKELPAMITESLRAAQAACEAGTTSGAAPPLIGLLMGPLATSLQPHGQLPFAMGIEAYREVVKIAQERSVDLYVLDAMPDLQTVKAALIAIRELAPGQPVAVQLAFGELGRTASGASPATALAVCRSFAVDLIGASGLLNPAEMRGVASMFGRLSDVPVMLQPHAIKTGAARSGKIRPNEFASQMKALLEFGVAVIGCSASPGPHYPAHLHRLVRKTRPALAAPRQRTLLASESTDVDLGGGRGLVLIQAWDGGTRDMRSEGSDAQTPSRAAPALSKAAQVCEVRYAYRGGDESRFLRDAVPVLQSTHHLPVLIQAESRRGLEAALAVTEGRPLVWGAWLSKEALDQTVPLALRYGAAIVAVTMSGTRPPQSAEDRIEQGNELIEELISRGVPQESILIDPVVTELDPRGPAALYPLQAMVELKSRWGQPALIRLPRLTSRWDRGRREIEAAYLAMAVAAGVDAAVGEFGFPPLRHIALAASLLAGRDPGGRRFQNHFEFSSGQKRAPREMQRDDAIRDESRPGPPPVCPEGGDRQPSRVRTEGGDRQPSRVRTEGGGGGWHPQRGGPESGGDRRSSRGRSEGGGAWRPPRARTEGGGGWHPQRGGPESGGDRRSSRGRPEGGGTWRPPRARPEGGGARRSPRGRPEGGDSWRPPRARPEGGDSWRPPRARPDSGDSLEGRPPRKTGARGSSAAPRPGSKGRPPQSSSSRPGSRSASGPSSRSASRPASRPPSRPSSRPPARGKSGGKKGTRGKSKS